MTANMTPEAVKAIAVGYHVCAIREDGTLACWGYGSAAPPAGTYVAIDMGDAGACAIREDGGVTCWNVWDGAVWQVPRDAFSAVSVGAGHACAIRRDDGSIVCWSALGEEDWTEDPEEEESPSIDPATGPPPGSFVDVSAGDVTDCALRADGSLACWSDYPDAQIFARDRYSSVDLPCAVTVGGSIDCFSSNEAEMIESGLLPPTQSVYLDLSVAPMSERGCGLRVDGTLRCWGDEGYDEDGPVRPMRTPPGTYRDVSVGDMSACALRVDGLAVCWGEDDVDVRPAPTMQFEVPLFVRERTIPIRWSARGAFADVTSYDIELIQGWDEEGSVAESEAWRTATTPGRAPFRGTPGETHCWRARAHDADGRTSDWNGDCTWVPDDDTVFKRSAGWTTVRDSRLYLGRAVSTTTRGARLTVDVDAFGLALFAKTCPTCGTIKIIDGSGEGETISLRTKKPHYIRVVWNGDNGEDGYWTSDGDSSGHIVIKVTSSGRPVTIDGLLQGPSLDEVDGWIP